MLFALFSVLRTTFHNGGVGSEGAKARRGKFRTCARRRAAASPTARTRFGQYSVADVAWPLVLAYTGLPSASSLARTNRGMRRLWDNPDFWRQLMTTMGLSPLNVMSCRGQLSTDRAAAELRLRDAASRFRERLRRRLLVDEYLMSLAPTGQHPLVRAKMFGFSAPTSTLGRLVGARKGICALVPEDGLAVIALATRAITRLLRECQDGGGALDDEVRRTAEALLQEVASRGTLFGTSQLLEMLGAFQAAEAASLDAHVQDKIDTLAF